MGTTQSQILNKISPSLLANKTWLMPAEKSMAIVALAAGLIDVALIVYNKSIVDWAGYLAILAVVVAMMTMGFVYRLSGRSGRIGAAAICAGLFIFYSLCLSMFNYQLLPLWREPIDLGLTAIDSIFGYHWPTVIAWSAEHPIFNSVTRFAYLSTIPQFAAMVVILGLSGRIKDLHVLIASITITATFTICFWGVFPSFGTTTLFDIPQALETLVMPVANTAYGDQLLLMAEQGPGTISPKEIKGLVAFPSYHIVLAVTAVYASRHIKWVFPVYLVLNALIVPSIFIHGGHHFVDLPAGILVAVVGLYLAQKSVAKDYEKHELPEYLES